MTRVMPADLARLLRRVALPLGWYYVVTLALPLANGAAQSGAAFAGHALVVLVVPLIGIACAWAIRATVNVSFRWPNLLRGILRRLVCLDIFRHSQLRT